MIKINELKLPLESDESDLKRIASKCMKCSEDEFKSVRILKKSIDSRKKEDIHFVYNIAVETKSNEKTILQKSKYSKAELYNIKPYVKPENKRKSKLRPIVVGFGPAGFFAGLILARSGLKPVIIERGSDVDTRTKCVNSFWNNKVLNSECNVQYGEGGAGTFSDGKLTTGIKDGFCGKVLEEFVAHGAPEEIIYSATPHIGTDRLVDVVKSFRKEIIALGGEVKFDTKLTDLIIVNGVVQGITVQYNDGRTDDLETDTVILCIGHSARDTAEMLLNKGLDIMQKPFSVGVRIEHPREVIDRAQFGEKAGHPKLGAAVYKMACHPENGRGAYTFCMCPGGTVVSASSEEGHLVVNGMSVYDRNGENSNSALLVGIEPEQFESNHPLAGIELQRKIERKAFLLGGSDYTAPCQLVSDFLNNRESDKLGSVKPTCPTGVTPSDIRKVLPKRITDTLSDAIIKMDKMLNGFAMNDAVLTAPETRSSSAIRIIRDDLYQSNIRGIYPCGEGAGYAGGIVSAGVDGIRCAHAVIEDASDLW